MGHLCHRHVSLLGLLEDVTWSKPEFLWSLSWKLIPLLYYIMVWWCLTPCSNSSMAPKHMTQWISRTQHANMTMHLWQPWLGGKGMTRNNPAMNLGWTYGHRGLYILYEHTILNNIYVIYLSATNNIIYAACTFPNSNKHVGCKFL